MVLIRIILNFIIIFIRIRVKVLVSLAFFLCASNNRGFSAVVCVPPLRSFLE